VEKLGNSAKFVLAVGACAAFGGIPAAKPNPTGAKPVSEIIPVTTIVNIAGCPPHPDWIVGTIAHVLLFGMPELDEYRLPTVFFGKTVHEQCERRGYFEEDMMAQDFSDDGCLFELGSRGQLLIATLPSEIGIIRPVGACSPVHHVSVAVLQRSLTMKATGFTSRFLSGRPMAFRGPEKLNSVTPQFAFGVMFAERNRFK
jgi:hypothetical protein